MDTAVPAPVASPTAVARTTAAAVASPTPDYRPIPNSALIGDWSFRAETGERDILGTLRFRREGNAMVGQYISPNGQATLLANLDVLGNRISWDLVTPRTTWHMRGTFSENWMNGTFQTATQTIQWTATKDGGAPGPTPTPGR
jgi:hypothetical protein